MARATYAVERSATIAAAPETVYDLVADFRAWRRWSPWEELDPNLERRYSGAEAGQGAVYEWSGNRKAGQGRMEILEATPPERIEIALEFLKPFRSSNRTVFAFAPEGDGTRVRWSMTGPRPLLMRLLGFAFSFEKMIGRDFDKGLAALADAATGQRG